MMVIDWWEFPEINLLVMTKMKTTLKARFLLALKRVELTQADVAREMGISPQNITHWLKRGSVPARQLFRLCEILNCSPQWLLTGEEKPNSSAMRGKINYSADEMDVPGAIGGREPGGYSPDPRNAGMVPLVTRGQAAEVPFEVGRLTPDEMEQWLYCNAPHSADTFAIRVWGDSMTAAFGRSYPAGCIIFVDPDQSGKVTSGDPVVARLSGADEVTFKILECQDNTKFLRPLNPQFPISTDEFSIIGKVIEKLEVIE